LDEEDFILSQHYWEEGDDSILNLFGTYMQHPEEKFVQYFGRTPVVAFEQGSLRRCSPRKKNEQGSPTCSPMKNPEVMSEKVSLRLIEPTVDDQQNPAEEITASTAATVAAATATATAAVAARTATTKTMAASTMAASTTAASNNNVNPQPNVQAQAAVAARTATTKMTVDNGSGNNGSIK